MSKLKIGKISYTNTWPVSHFFNYEEFQNEIEFIPQVPSQLNKQMAAGAIDIGAISSFSYGENADKYFLLPDLSVSAYGTVGSISLFFKSELEDIAHQKIALSNTSATSVNLLKIIVEEFLAGKPEYISMPPTLEEMMSVADAGLLIGDEALLAGVENEKTKKYKMIDLGNEWLKRTGQWMTFAVWAVRKEVVENNPQLLSRIYQEFLTSKAKGKQQLDVIVTEAMSKFGETPKFWHDYFNGLSNDFGTEQIKGLNHYFMLAHKIGALKSIPKIRVVDFEKSMLQYVKK